MVTESKELTTREDEPRELLQMPPGAAGVIIGNVNRMEELVTKALERDVDFGRSPGVPQPYLWDSGAAKIMAAFNLYAQHKIIHQAENAATGALTIVMEASLVSRSSGQIIATGVGAASGLEVKNKYRWVENPEEHGVDKTTCQSKPDEKWENGRRVPVTKYRILNPEFGEQFHNLMKSAAKRAEIDAVQSLPGVLPCIKKLGQVGQSTQPGKPGQKAPEGDINLQAFWVVVKGLNYTEAAAYDVLGIKSLQMDWIKIGKRLTDAVDILAKHAEGAKKPAATVVDAQPAPAVAQNNPIDGSAPATAEQWAEIARIGKPHGWTTANACEYVGVDTRQWKTVTQAQAVDILTAWHKAAAEAGPTTKGPGDPDYIPELDGGE